MTDDVVDAVDGFAGRPCERLGAGDADGEASGQPWSGGDRNGVDVGQVETGVGECLAYDRGEGLGVGA